jgi:hypothetical protein
VHFIYIYFILFFIDLSEVIPGGKKKKILLKCRILDVVLIVKINKYFLNLFFSKNILIIYNKPFFKIFYTFDDYFLEYHILHLDLNKFIFSKRKRIFFIYY